MDANGERILKDALHNASYDAVLIRSCVPPDWPSQADYDLADGRGESHAPTT